MISTKAKPGQRRVTTPVKQKAEAVAAASGKQPSKAKAPRKRGNGSGPVQRLSNVWPSSRGKDVDVKDTVRMSDARSSRS